MDTLPMNRFIKGTPEQIEKRFSKFYQDLKTYQTRPFLDKYEKHDFLVYHNYYASNHIIGLLNFDSDGNYLPELLQAPQDIQRMLYPIDDLIGFEKQGTLIIDPEQYSPELRKISYCIYIVDEELYETYKKEQNYLGETKATYIFDRNFNDGVRIFKSYYELAKHLARKRLITYCIGPRALFYLRWYLYQIHVHTVQPEWTYGTKIKNSTAHLVLEILKRHLAFQHHQDFDYNFELTIDKFQEYRTLEEKFRTFFPKAEHYKSRTMIQRYSKQTMTSCVLARVKTNKQRKYDEKLGIKPWHHLLMFKDYAIAYIWDTRLIELIVPVTEFEDGDLTYNVVDNRNDLMVKDSSPKEVKEFCEQYKELIPIQFRYGASDLEFNGDEEQFWKIKSGELTETK